MARPLVSDELWELIEPLIPTVKRRYRYPGCKRIDDRKVLTGILFVLRTGIPWEYLPKEMDCGSGVTCWRRLREWQQAVSYWGSVSQVITTMSHWVRREVCSVGASAGSRRSPACDAACVLPQ